MIPHMYFHQRSVEERKVQEQQKKRVQEFNGLSGRGLEPKKHKCTHTYTYTQGCTVSNIHHPY